MTASADMKAFVRIVELGSFARAAEDLRVTPSALSKLISRLEDRLGVRLLMRSTRRLALTPEGALYHERAQQVLALIERTEADVASSRSRPKGLLRINASTGFARQTLLQVVPAFMVRYPEVRIDLSLTDRLIDPVSERVDIVIRGSPTTSGEFTVRELSRGRRVICAAPAYLARRGTPSVPSDLASHNCLALTGRLPPPTWSLSIAGTMVEFEPQGSFSSDNVGMLLDMALEGHGIVRLADFVVGPALKDGRLVEILTDANCGAPISLWVLMAKGRFVSPRVQVFLEFLEHFLSRSGEMRPAPAS